MIKTATPARPSPLLARLVEPIRQDPGCSRCHLVANNGDGTELVFIEEWKDDQALDLQLADAFIADVVAQAAPPWRGR